MSIRSTKDIHDSISDMLTGLADEKVRIKRNQSALAAANVPDVTVKVNGPEQGRDSLTKTMGKE